MMRRPTPGNGEDLLDDHGATEQRACDYSGDRQNRNQRIRKAVTQHDLGALQPLGVGRADEVLIQDFQHRRSGHARDEADLDDGQRQGRHEDASPAQPRGSSLRGHIAAGREEAELHGKQQDQHDPEPEIGNRQPEQG